MSAPLVSIVAFLVGACVGSFLNVCISRWPLDLSVVSPPSRCPTCARPIRWFENVPILGWLALRGRCRGCHLPISPMYPIVELTVALGWLAAVLAFGPTLTALRVAVLGTLLLGVAVTDAIHYVIPDGFTVSGLVWVLATAAAAAVLGESSVFAGLPDALFGACVGAGAIAIVGWLGEVILRREAMGFGDVTLMAVVGAALGPERVLLVIFVGAALGAVVFLGLLYPLLRSGVVGHGEQLELELGLPAALPHVPFGVFLAPAALVALLWGHDLVHWYLGHLATP